MQRSGMILHQQMPPTSGELPPGGLPAVEERGGPRVAAGLGCHPGQLGMVLQGVQMPPTTGVVADSQGMVLPHWQMPP